MGEVEHGLAVVPIELLQDLREQWTNAIAVAVKEGRAVVNVGLDGGDGMSELGMSLDGNGNTG